MKSRYKQVFSFAAIFFPLLFVPSFVSADFGSSFIESHSIRVIAKSGDGAKAASGFLWKNNTQVITSLHAVPRGSEISVECRGVRKPAKVSKMLVKADLILLNVQGLPVGCQPFTEFDPKKPERNTPLWTFGYHAGAKSLTDREFKKRFGSPERLDYLVTGKPLEEIKKLGYPDPKLDIYYVQGGLLPGYSGGPVVDKDGNLIGVVDGGLNRGASSYNWVIPAKYLDELVSVTENDIPVSTGASGSTAFASGIVEANESTSFTFTEGEFEESWVLTKSQSLFELAFTSDDPHGTLVLYYFFEEAAGLNEDQNLIFDIYEEQRLGLIIAVPKGQGLRYDDDGSGEDRLRSISKVLSSDNAQILFDSGAVQVTDNLGVDVSADAAEYFQHYVAGTLAKCHDPLQGKKCVLMDTLTRIIDFGEGYRILRFAVQEVDQTSGEVVRLNYFTLAVNDGFPLEAKASVSVKGESGLWQCFLADSPNEVSCGDPTSARVQLKQMLAVHLTTFPELQTGEDQRIVGEKIVFDSKYDETATKLVPYFDGEELRFFNTRGKLWRVFEDGIEDDAVEVNRADGHVTLKYLDKFYYKLPIAGGTYYEWSDDTEPDAVGELRAVYP